MTEQNNDIPPSESKEPPASFPVGMTQEEVFAKLNQSSERMLQALQSAYEAGIKEGLGDAAEDQVIELLCRAKKLRDEIRRATAEKD
ncbi:MAG: hypothetical protein PHS88_09400 [Candidatus Omnitrophica bacterium]|nr:hypothetical protein [Candidatus Omnitrophota bacterium]